MTDWILRPATPRDTPALTACMRAAYAVYDGTVSDLPDVSAGLDQDIRDHHVWLAVAGDSVLGGAVLVLGEAAHLANIAVDPGAGGKGIGRALIERLERVARQAGHSQMRLATHVDMPSNVALYERLGWHRTGQEGNKVLMAKPL